MFVLCFGSCAVGVLEMLCVVGCVVFVVRLFDVFVDVFVCDVC